MHKHTRSFLSAMVGIAATAAVLAAQDTTRKVSAGEVAFQPSYASVIAAVTNAKETVTAVTGMTEVKPEQIHVVDVTPLLGDHGRKEVESTLESNKTSINDLQSAVLKRGPFTKALAADPAKPKVEKVIGVDIKKDGNVWIYVDPAKPSSQQ